MIRAEKGKIEINGSGLDILADYSAITESMFEALVGAGASKDRAQKDLKQAFDFGLMSEDERQEAVREKLCNHPLAGLLKTLCDILKDEGDEK